MKNLLLIFLVALLISVSTVNADPLEPQDGCNADHCTLTGQVGGVFTTIHTLRHKKTYHYQNEQGQKLTTTLDNIFDISGSGTTVENGKKASCILAAGLANVPCGNWSVTVQYSPSYDEKRGGYSYRVVVSASELKTFGDSEESSYELYFLKGLKAQALHNAHALKH